MGKDRADGDRSDRFSAHFRDLPMSPAPSASANSNRKAYLVILGSALALGVGCWLFVHLETHCAGGVKEQLFASVFGEDTAYAPGYDEAKFMNVKMGIGEAAVRRELGEPLSRHGRRRTTYWVYAHSPKSRNYRVRQVVFEDGRVVGKLASYYWD